jgi:hypothetical protein
MTTAWPSRNSFQGSCQHWGIKAKILKPDNLALADRNAARNLGQVFAKGDLTDQLFRLAKAAVTLETRGPALHLWQGLDASRQPGQRMGRCLVLLHQLA